MRKRFAIVSAFVAVALITITAMAYATPGDSVGTGSIQIENVQTTMPIFTGSSTVTLTVDCPAGSTVITGFGDAIDTQNQGISSVVQGTKLDADSWSTVFNLNISRRYFLITAATCLKG